MLQIASECFQMLPNASRCFQMLPNASECTRMLPLFLANKGLGVWGRLVWGFLFKTPLPLYILRGLRPRKWNSKYMQKRIHRCYCEGSARGSSTPSSRRRMYIVAEECVSFGGNGESGVLNKKNPNPKPTSNPWTFVWLKRGKRWVGCLMQT